MDQPRSLFQRFIDRPRRPWIAPSICVLLFLTPLAIAYAQGSLSEILHEGGWRGLLVPPVIITYIVLIAPKMSQMGDRVIDAFRRIVLIDDANFARVIETASRIRPRDEVISISVGFLVGCLTAMRSFGGQVSWLTLEFSVANGLMYGLLTWTIYASAAGSRLITAVLRQPLQLDPLDITPFEPVGRQSLVAALAFIGGITLSLLLTGLAPASSAPLEFWLNYIPFALVPVIIFFLNMYPTHRVIAAARDTEQKETRARIRASYRDLLARGNGGLNTESIPAEINALVAYDQLLQKARTWPYNTAMLRTLGVSILIPVGTTLARAAFDYLFR
jgi:hypothetical protein